MKSIIQTPHAPAAIGTYSQAIRAGNTIYISGQIPLNPKTMTMCDGDFHAHVKQAFDNLKAVVTAADAVLSDIVKLTIFLRDMNQFSIVNEIMATYFDAPYPARAVVEVSRLPKDALIEMDAIVCVISQP
jgi:reactive intermediate/imine deaminase